MGKLIFPIKEMPEAPQDGKVYLRQNSSWIRLKQCAVFDHSSR
jgi:hypothetical protein